jgi:hypothetical protein
MRWPAGVVTFQATSGFGMQDLLDGLRAEALRLAGVIDAELRREESMNPILLRSHVKELDRTVNALIVGNGTAQRIERSR